MQRKWKRQWRRAMTKVFVPAALATTLFFSSYSIGLANPGGGTVTSGSAAIASSAATTTITQTTDKVAINWQSFDIAKGETVNFLQPGSSSVALNRVMGSSGSAIYGALNANGKVFLINPNGILFAHGSQVNVGSLVASTQNLSDSDFLKGNYTFTGTDGSGTVLNQGTIQAADGGYVALLGNQVTNEGVILANQGSVALAAGNATTLDFTGDGLINLNVSQTALDAQVTNSNLIQANGGLVVMTAKAAGDLTGTVVNNTGIIRAQGLAAKNGKIVLDGGISGVTQTTGTLDASSTTGMGGVIEVTGENIVIGDNARLLAGGATGGGQINIGGGWQGSGDISHAKTTTVNASAVVDASATDTGNGGTVVVWSDDKTTFAGTITAKGGQNGGDGGQVETSGKQTLKVADTARVNTLSVNGKNGNWLLDPQNYTIAASGGDITGATLSTNLSGGNITIHSSDGSASGSGDINVNDAVTWNSDNTLTLQADRNININSAITAGGNHAGLVLTPGTGGTYTLGSGAKVTLSGSSPTLTVGGQSYTVINSLAALQNISTGLGGYYALGSDLDAIGYTGYTPIGTSSSAFTGTFAGLGNTISNLTVSVSTSYAGLFGYSSGTIRDIGLVNGNIISTASYVGGLAGYNAGTISNSYYNGDVEGYVNIGGLVGYNDHGTISGSHSDGTVKSTGIGDTNVVGGLVGSSYGGTISNSYSASNVTSVFGTGASGLQANYVAGGLVGGAWDGGTISYSYSTGNVTGSSTIGGLVGVNFAAINNSYSSGTVTGTSNDIGGLVGVNYAAITDSHSSATVIGDSAVSNDVGGLVGVNYHDAGYVHVGTISNSDSTGTVSGYIDVGGLVGNNFTTGNTITDSHSTGAVTGYRNVGGLVGFNSGTIQTSYSEGTVTGTIRVGGLAGVNYADATDVGSITDSYSTGAVTGSNLVGGLVGYNVNAAIDTSTSSSAVTRSGSISVTSSSQGLAVGGLVGYNTGTISDSSSSGAVGSNDTGVTNNTGSTLGSYTGGLVGNNAGAISNSTSTSTVTSTAGNNGSGISAYYAGKLTGKNQATIDSNSYGSGTATLDVNGPLAVASDGLMLVASDDINVTSAVMTYTGSDGSFVTMQAGQNITLTDAIIQSTDGALDVTLSAGLDATSTGSIKMLKNTSGSKIISSGGDILLGGAVTGGVLGALNGNPNDNAIQLNNAELISGSGKIVMKSDGGHTAVVLTDSKLTTTTGDIWIEGTSSFGVPANGVNMQGTVSRANMAISSQDGNITIKGTSLGGTDWHNTGIWLTKVLIETTGTGNITVEGTAGAGTHASRGQNQGIRMLTDSLIQTVNGDISLVGIGASSAGTEGFNYGIWLYDSSLQSTGSGDISLQGVGGAGGDYNFGVVIDKSGAGSFVTTNTGTIDITGTGGTVGTDLRGIYSVAGTAISSTSGDISLTAIGTNSQGYALTNRSTISTGGTGTISLTGVAVNGVGGSVSSTGTLTTDKQAITIAADGNIALNGNINAGTTLNNTGGVITLQSNGGTVTDASGITIAADGLVLKGAGASYVLDDANYIIGRLAADTGSVTFVQTGGVSIDTVGSVSGITATGPVSITTPSPVSGSATLYINAPITITSNTPTTLTLRSGNNLILNQGSAITAGNAAVNVLMASNLSGNGGYVRLLQNSAVTTNGGSLTIGGGSNGTDYAVAADPYEYEGVWIATSTINTGAGDITVRGKGYSGVRINGGSLTTTSGSIILDGVGDATGGSDASQTGGTGVFIKSYTGLDGTLQPTVPTVIQTDTGNITITGTSNNSGTDPLGSQTYFTGVNIWSDSRDMSESTAYKGVYIGSRNGDITITGHRSAGDTSANGNAGISTSSLTRIETTGSGNISLSNDNGGTAPANEIGIILAGDVLSAGSGNVTVRGIEGLNLAGGNITAANGYISMYATENATQVNAATNLSSGTINGNLLLDGSAVYTLTSSQNGIQTLAGSARGLKLTTGTPLTVGTVNSVSGLDVQEDLFLTVASEGGLLTIDAPVTRHYASHTFGLTADRMAINAQVDQGQTNDTWAKIAPYTAGWGIVFGSTTDTASNALEISAAEYAKLGIVTGSDGATSRNIQYGDTNTGAIQITDYMVNNSADNQYRTSVRLVNSSAITESGSGAIEADRLVVLSDGDITLNGLNQANYFAAVSNNNDIEFHDALSDGGVLAIYPIGSYGGINAGTGNLTLTIDGIASVVNMGSSITANGLELVGPSARFWLYGSTGVDLTINTLAGNVGTAAIGAKNSFSIGTVGNTVGLTSNGVTIAGAVKRALGLESGGTITQTAAISALDLYLGEGSFDLTNTNNHAEKITTYSYTNDNNTSTVNVNYYDKGDILVNTAYENLYASGTVKLQGKSISVPDGDAGNNGMGIVSGGDITLIADDDITIGSSIISTGGDILLAAGEKFINNTASDTGLVANAGRYMVYSANPTDTVEGMTGYSKHYNQAYTAGTTPDYSSSGNWFFYSIAPVISVTPGSQSATYGTSPGSFTPGYTGLIDGDTAVTAGISGTAAFSISGSLSGSGNYTAGSHEVTYTSGLASSLGYTFIDNAVSLNELTVTPKALTVTAVGGSRVYDGSVDAAGVVSYGDNRVSGDSLTVNGDAEFADKNAGTGKTVSIDGLTVSGTDAGNYTLNSTTGSTTADITQRTLTVTAVGGSRVYDGSVNADGVVSYGDNRVAGDSLTVSGSAVFADAAQGPDKPVSISGLTLIGTDAANYNLFDQTAGVTADILPAAPNEQIETAVTHSRNQMIIQPASPVLPGNETDGNSVSVEIAQTGINQVGLAPLAPAVQTPDVAQPSPRQEPAQAIQLTPLGGQTSGYYVAISGQTWTVTAVGATPATGSAAESSGNLAVFLVKPGEAAQPIGYYTATGGNGGLTLAAAAAGIRTVPVEPADTAAVTTYHLAAGAGAQAEFKDLYADGVLSIYAVNEAAAALLQAGGDNSNLVVATGILTAQQNLGVMVQSIAAVILH